MAYRLVPVEIKAVGHLALYVKGGYRIVGGYSEFRQPLVDGPRGLRAIDGRRSGPQDAARSRG